MPRTPYTDDSALPDISDEEFQALRDTARGYSLVILRAGPEFVTPGPAGDPRVTEIVMAHGKRNARLLKAGLMPIVCPVGDASGLAGIGIFDAQPEEAARIMDADPGVQAGVFTYEVHACRGFPGSALPNG